jgi:hypothetical protein
VDRAVLGEGRSEFANSSLPLTPSSNATSPVRDYEILYRVKDDWRSLKKVAGNHQRLNRHRFDAIESGSIRVRVDATDGSDEARIFEIRVYSRTIKR